MFWSGLSSNMFRCRAADTLRAAQGLFKVYELELADSLSFICSAVEMVLFTRSTVQFVPAELIHMDNLTVGDTLITEVPYTHTHTLLHPHTPLHTCTIPSPMAACHIQFQMKSVPLHVHFSHTRPATAVTPILSVMFNQSQSDTHGCQTVRWL